MDMTELLKPTPGAKRIPGFQLGQQAKRTREFAEMFYELRNQFGFDTPEHRIAPGISESLVELARLLDRKAAEERRDARP